MAEKKIILIFCILISCKCNTRRLRSTPTPMKDKFDPGSLVLRRERHFQTVLQIAYSSHPCKLLQWTFAWKDAICCYIDIHLFLLLRPHTWGHSCASGIIMSWSGDDYDVTLGCGLSSFKWWTSSRHKWSHQCQCLLENVPKLQQKGEILCLTLEESPARTWRKMFQRGIQVACCCRVVGFYF